MAAEKVLKQSLKPLSLSRLAPNLLSGEGAAEFAFDAGIPLFPHDKLISKRAKAAWRSWRRELEELEAPLPSQALRTSPEMRLLYDKLINDTRLAHTIRQQGRRMDSDELGALYLDMGRRLSVEGSNSGNCDSSPEQSPRPLRGFSALEDSAGNTAVLDCVLASHRQQSAESNDGDCDSLPCSPPPAFQDVEMVDGVTVPSAPATHPPCTSLAACKRGGHQDGRGAQEYGGHPQRCRFQSLEDESNLSETHDADDVDDVSDTIGVIVVDIEGSMSCAASSGGLGLKMRGRVGPAALNGVGAYLIPPDPSDPSKLAVSCVASGTGEHMTTTLASGISAERVYHCKAKHSSGVLFPCPEDDVLRLFIEKEFLSECTHDLFLILASCRAIGGHSTFAACL